MVQISHQLQMFYYLLDALALVSDIQLHYLSLQKCSIKFAITSEQKKYNITAPEMIQYYIIEPKSIQNDITVPKIIHYGITVPETIQ